MISFRTILFRSSLALAAAGGVALHSGSARACGAEPYYGEICYFGGTYCPAGTTPADGRLMTMSQYPALYSLLGTFFGGDGKTTFGLPDLRGRIPVGIGQGPSLSNVTLGEKRGTETATLTIANLPAHTHPASFTATATAVSTLPVNTSPTPATLGTLGSSGNNFLVNATGAGLKGLYTQLPPAAGDTGVMPVNTTVTLDSSTVTVQPAGSANPAAFSIVNPGLGLTACVVTSDALYPQRPQ